MTVWAVLWAVLLWTPPVAMTVGPIWAGVLSVTRTRRLERLHLRCAAARTGLHAALARRRDAADRAADGATSGATSGAADRAADVRAAVAAARAAAPAELEPAENALGRRLAALPRGALPAGVAAELAEAEQVLALARRVHNDAVRDTLALRSRRLVRWLHLAGGAPAPAYFDIADGPGVTGPAVVIDPGRAAC